MAMNGLRYVSGEYATQSDLATNAGLNLIVTQSFSAASSVSLNNCFTATYANYFVTVEFTAISANGATFARLRASGTDNSSSYRTEHIDQYGSNVFGTTNPAGDGTKWTILANAGSASPELAGCNIVLQKPQLAQKTVGFGRAAFQTSGSTFVSSIPTYWHDVATSYDGFTLFPGSGTISGTLRIYGYRNSV